MRDCEKYIAATFTEISKFSFYWLQYQANEEQHPLQPLMIEGNGSPPPPSHIYTNIFLTMRSTFYIEKLAKNQSTYYSKHSNIKVTLKHESLHYNQIIHALIYTQLKTHFYTRHLKACGRVADLYSCLCFLKIKYRFENIFIYHLKYYLLKIKIYACVLY